MDAPPAAPKPCCVCAAPGGKHCTLCKSRHYCSKACQVIDWKERGHKEQCKQMAADFQDRLQRFFKKCGKRADTPTASPTTCNTEPFCCLYSDSSTLWGTVDVCPSCDNPAKAGSKCAKSKKACTTNTRACGADAVWCKATCTPAPTKYPTPVPTLAPTPGEGETAAPTFTPSATADGARRRVASGRLSMGDGARTAIFGGGRRATRWSDAAQLRSAVRRDADGRFKLAAEFADASDGQARWLARSVFAHTSLSASPGVFVEFGGCDGFFQSNTLVFERSFGWSGVLIEAGRDYMHGMREGRNCRAGGVGGACVWAALNDRAGDKVYWNVFDITSSKVNLKDLKKEYDSQKYQATAEDREVRTMALQQVLDRFDLKHVDYLSADCEGCEAKAFAGLDLTKTKVDVISIEWTPCETAQRLLESGYVLVPLRFKMDQIFIHARVARQMPAPDLFLDSADDIQDLRGFGHAQKLAKECAGVEDGTWWGGAWPPKRLERFADL
ncbi:hypothetical protein M885DRAFT_616617 [Pelagophyceae sp. CCMP2097]|nr:hypothetical protein M885DRAFT_616617 [Pelagophyceae sp. CCMP2097]